MKYTLSISVSTVEVKQSKFIAWITPYGEYERVLQKLKTEHSKARHFVTAFRYLNEFDQIVEHSSDDGEPKGTSGKPSLMVLQGKKLINCAVIIVRYFGGTKLGIGGLVRAYSDAVNSVISQTELLEYKKEVISTIEINYSDARFVDYECEIFGVTILEKMFESTAVYKVQTDNESMKLFLEKIGRVVITFL